MSFVCMRGMAGYGLPYDDDGEEGAHDDVCNLPLDPIEVACQLDVMHLQSTSQDPYLEFSKIAFKFITDEVFFREQIISEKGSTGRQCSAKKWWPHIQKLVVFTILIAIAWKDVSETATYFAVEKAGNTARSIYNGRRGVQLTNPPPINMPYLPDLLEKIADEKNLLTWNWPTADSSHSTSTTSSPSENRTPSRN